MEVRFAELWVCNLGNTLLFRTLRTLRTVSRQGFRLSASHGRRPGSPGRYAGQLFRWYMEIVFLLVGETLCRPK